MLTAFAGPCKVTDRLICRIVLKDFCHDVDVC